MDTQAESRWVEVQISGGRKKVRYHAGPAHKQFVFGGTEDGMRAITYIAQTFFAHSFPDVARLEGMHAVKDYTLDNKGSGFSWWDFEPPTILPPNKFRFGHRIVVGLNADEGAAYARVSLFSTLNFAVAMGRVPVEKSLAVITDIDPLAKSPPNDIVTWTEDTAIGSVYRPSNLTSSLGGAVRSGRAQAEVEGLIRQIEDFERENAAAEIHTKIAHASSMADAERDDLIKRIVTDEGQRVFRLMD